VLLLLRLLLRLLLLLLLLLLRLSERQKRQGRAWPPARGEPSESSQSLLVDGAGRERTSEAERGDRSGGLQWLLDVVAQLLRVVES
jgi:hypothetical protein